MPRTSIVLTAQQLTALRHLARHTGLRISELIRRAVDAFLERQQGKP